MEQHGIEQRTISRVTWRLIPFMMLRTQVAFIDRSTLGATKLQMTQFDNPVYGFAAGIFFFGYFLSIGNLGGHFGPASMGWLRETTKSCTTGLLVLAGCFLAGAILAVAIRIRKTAEASPAPPSAAPSGSSSSG